MNETEMVVMDLITHSGNARSNAIQAVREARKNDFERAERLMKEANDELVLAHKTQTNLLFNETSGKRVDINLLMIHAQDHVMNAITVKDLANEMIQMMKENYLKGKEL